MNTSNAFSQKVWPSSEEWRLMLGKDAEILIAQAYKDIDNDKIMEELRDTYKCKAKTRAFANVLKTL